MIPSPAWQERASFKGKAFVYLLRSSKGRFYLGWTTDIKRRLGEHNSGGSLYTRSRGPWELVSYEAFSSIEDAKERERTVKKNPRMFKLLKKRALATLRVSAALQQNMQVMG
ncbi:MAG: GIY-YIG nuclease family protein [Candidatus Omnitrophica bacterium]|nr:GIY-YIG nuclease family protein [Candidatus Omnitrophota bacterium]